MKAANPKARPALLAAALAVILAAPHGAGAQSTEVDPAATRILKRMTDYLAGLKQFSVSTDNDLEDLLDSGQRIDVPISASVLVKRPDKLLAERTDGGLEQRFYYDGKTLTLYNPAGKVYATESAPGTIEQTLDFARESLGVTVPVADLIYRNAFAVLMQDVTAATVVGKSVIDGRECDHLAFRRPGVDFQVWVESGDRPLPCKYVVTDTSTPALVSISTDISGWNLEPDAPDSRFSFAPPTGATKVTFMRQDGASGSGR